MLDLLTGVELSTGPSKSPLEIHPALSDLAGVLGAYTPTLLQGHADLLNDESKLQTITGSVWQSLFGSLFSPRLVVAAQASCFTKRTRSRQ